MSDPSDSPPRSRRQFIGETASAGLALIFGSHAGRLAVILREPGGAQLFEPSQWVSISDSGEVTISTHKTEMGQGVRTSLSAIVAAELGADWASVRVVHAQPGPRFADMGTSGSGSIEDSWGELRRAAAAARETLTRAAAERWGVSMDECTTASGRVTHPSTQRSLGFGELVGDAARLALPEKPQLRPDTQLTLLGSRLHRVDGADIVTGRAVYGIDVRVPGMRFATLARPPVAGAVLRSFDERAARAVPGVLAVTRIAGGVAVVATSSWAAMQGRSALSIVWDDDPRPDADSASYLRALHAALPTGKVGRREGDASAVIRASRRVLTATYQLPFQAHAALEPLTCVADVRPDRCEVWVGTQRPNTVKTIAAEIAGVGEDRVTVHVTLIGGAFGRRIATDHAREALELSRAIGEPVQLLWTREDDFAHDMYQPAQVNRFTASLDSGGHIEALRHEVADYHLSMFGRRNPNANPANDEDPWGGFDSPYVVPALEVTLAVLDPPVPTGAWRSVAYPAAVFARESFLDEIAHATKRDPLDLRMELLSKPPNAPAHRNAERTASRLMHVLQLVSERSGWRHNARSFRRDGRHWGMGLACNPYHGDGAMVAQVAEVSVGKAGDIRVHRVTTAIDVGRVIDRSGLEAQVEGGVAWALSAALHSQVTFTNGRADQTNYHQFPVVRMRDMPEQDIVIVDSSLRPFGAGEPPVPAVFAAVANALFAATGQRIRTAPFKIDSTRMDA